MVIKLSKPFAPLTAALADRAGMVLSPAAVAKLGANFSTAPVCVGPFKFASRVAQNSIKVVKDPLYYDAAKVHLDAIEYRIITDSSIRSANLKSGDAQVADSLSTQDAPTLQKDSTHDRAAVAVARVPGPDHQHRERERHRQPAQAARHPDREGPAGPPGARAVDRPRGAGEVDLQRAEHGRLLADLAEERVHLRRRAGLPAARPREGEAVAGRGRRRVRRTRSR